VLNETTYESNQACYYSKQIITLEGQNSLLWVDPYPKSPDFVQNNPHALYLGLLIPGSILIAVSIAALVSSIVLIIKAVNRPLYRESVDVQGTTFEEANVSTTTYEATEK